MSHKKLGHGGGRREATVWGPSEGFSAALCFWPLSEAVRVLLCPAALARLRLFLPCPFREPALLGSSATPSENRLCSCEGHRQNCGHLRESGARLPQAFRSSTERGGGHRSQVTGRAGTKNGGGSGVSGGAGRMTVKEPTVVLASGTTATKTAPPPTMIPMTAESLPRQRKSSGGAEGHATGARIMGLCAHAWHQRQKKDLLATVE